MHCRLQKVPRTVRVLTLICLKISIKHIKCALGIFTLFVLILIYVLFMLALIDKTVIVVLILV